MSQHRIPSIVPQPATETRRSRQAEEYEQALARVLAPRRSILARRTLPGLEFLTRVDAIMVKQEMELLEVFTASGINGNNHYALSSTSGQRIFYAAENSNFCSRICLRGGRPFQIHLLDFTGTAVLLINRPCPCGLICCCSGLCKNKVFITHMNGELLGVMKQVSTCCTPTYYILSPSGKRTFYVIGPTGGHWCCCRMCWTVTFRVCLGDKVTQIGQITKEWGGIVKEGFSAADTFGVQFPMELDPKFKAVLLGAVFLIDFMYF